MDNLGPVETVESLGQGIMNRAFPTWRPQRASALGKRKPQANGYSVVTGNRAHRTTKLCGK